MRLSRITYDTKYPDINMSHYNLIRIDPINVGACIEWCEKNIKKDWTIQSHYTTIVSHVNIFVIKTVEPENNDDLLFTLVWDYLIHSSKIKDIVIIE